MSTKIVLVICTSFLVVFTETGLTNSPQAGPPLLMEFIIQTHSWFCPNVTETVLVMDSFERSAFLQEQILQKFNTPLVVLNDTKLIDDTLLRLTCVIFFSVQSHKV